MDGQGIEATLPVPEFCKDKPYLLGFFLVGAYQEILGDMHNLFGDTHTVVATLDDQGELSLGNIDAGDTVADMMRYVHLDVEQFKRNFANLVESKLPLEEQAACLAELETGLDDYTYLEDF
ncbi:hypothetical protein PPEP_a3808 [Pseudoalteromonas peptidolytica F12-50-A1]|uniref:Arginine decarboxylase C-terminal helical domain-containing protein n=1 Tax=Pseudoalteromonas peptidolytica F12-50-A1 TaxID=1315280 RepID=A0A8I0MW25_9GAMM|nr:hypothetical protein [Pseudoalteromonas peptidolytica F12-50-A1]GEK10113.1 hypothetical protein PPE03_23620 [Pseudoalteromonas peptidolytica]